METIKKTKVKKYSELPTSTKKKLSKNSFEYNQKNYKNMRFDIKIEDLEKLEKDIEEKGWSKVFYFKNALKLAYNLELK